MKKRISKKDFEVFFYINKNKNSSYGWYIEGNDNDDCNYFKKPVILINLGRCKTIDEIKSTIIHELIHHYYNGKDNEKFVNQKEKEILSRIYKNKKDELIAYKTEEILKQMQEIFLKVGEMLKDANN